MEKTSVKEDGALRDDAERRRHLGDMLGDLVKQKGRMEVSELLGVNYKTVVRAEETGRITNHMARALERLFGNGEGKASETFGEDVLKDRILQLEEEMAELWETLETPRPTAGGKGAEGRGEEDVVGVGVGVGDDGGDKPGDPESGMRETREEGESTSGAAPSVEGLNDRGKWRPKRKNPELVTEAPAEDDPEVFGAAWTLVEEWRRVREGHPYQGKSLSWLETLERLLVLELAMLEEHGLTLPPETQPLRGFGRRAQTRWRHMALHDTRRAIGRRKMLRWVRRVLTLGLWWK